MEFGYMQSQRTKRTVNLVDGDYVLGHQVIAGIDDGEHKLKLKSRAFHLNLVGFYPMTDKLDFIGSIGIDWLNVTAYHIFNNEIYDMKSKKAILDLGIGLKYMVNEKFGARAMVNWQNKSKLADLTYTNGETYTAKIKNSFKFGLGVFFYPI